MSYSGLFPNLIIIKIRPTAVISVEHHLCTYYVQAMTEDSDVADLSDQPQQQDDQESDLEHHVNLSLIHI